MHLYGCNDTKEQISSLRLGSCNRCIKITMQRKINCVDYHVESHKPAEKSKSHNNFTGFLQVQPLGQTQKQHYYPRLRELQISKLQLLKLNIQEKRFEFQTPNTRSQQFFIRKKRKWRQQQRDRMCVFLHKKIPKSN